MMEEKSQKILKEVNQLIADAITYKQTNEQWFLDFLKSLSNINKGNLDNFRKWNIKKLPKKSGIYCFENKINGKLYIGQAQNIKERIRHHIKSKDHLYIHKALRKYGVDNFNFYILEFCSIDKLSELEIYYIQKYNTFKYGYNLTAGGEGGKRGVKLSKKQKSLISKYNSKDVWAYNFKFDYFLKAKSAEKLANKINKKRYNISKQNIYDAVSDNSYSKDFTFGHTKEDALAKINYIKPPKEIELYLYNYKTKQYSPKFTSIADGENYIRNLGYKINKGHLSTAINKNNKYIKDFLFAKSLDELQLKVKSFIPYLYLYNIIENKLFKFENNVSNICDYLTMLGYKVNIASFNKAKVGLQKQACGFIIGTSIEDLLNKIMKINVDMCNNIYNLAKENNYLNSQELINWQDTINEISVK